MRCSDGLAAWAFEFSCPSRASVFLPPSERCLLEFSALCSSSGQDFDHDESPGRSRRDQRRTRPARVLGSSSGDAWLLGAMCTEVSALTPRELQVRAQRFGLLPSPSDGERSGSRKGFRPGSDSSHGCCGRPEGLRPRSSEDSGTLAQDWAAALRGRLPRHRENRLRCASGEHLTVLHNDGSAPGPGRLLTPGPGPRAPLHPSAPHRRRGGWPTH